MATPGGEMAIEPPHQRKLDSSEKGAYDVENGVTDHCVMRVFVIARRCVWLVVPLGAFSATFAVGK